MLKFSAMKLRVRLIQLLLIIITIPSCTSIKNFTSKYSPFTTRREVVMKGEGKREEVEDPDRSVRRRNTSERLVLHDFQEMVERKAFASGGGAYVAPAQRMTDFINGKISNSLPATSYLRGVHSVDINEVLPEFISKTLREGFKSFGKKMKGYLTEEAIIVAPESRTSSPVRIPRDQEKLHHPQIKNLYPCGEGAGYAGGIVSAAMDGIKVAHAIQATHQ